MHRVSSLSCVVCDAIGEIGRNGPLPLQDGQENITDTGTTSNPSGSILGY